MNNSLTLEGSSDRAYHNLREKEEKRTRDRRRQLLYLIAVHLQTHGYTKTFDTLHTEAQLSEDIQVCDNIDLEMILMEFDAYYHMKFNKYPSLCKNIVENKKNLRKQNIHDNKGAKKNDSEKGKPAQQTIDSVPKNNLNLAMTVTPLSLTGNSNQSSMSKTFESCSYSNISKVIEDLYPADSELRKMAEMVSKEIILTNLDVHWNDVIGLKNAKDDIRNAAVYPMKYPIFFHDKFSPWKGILLYGPPGTGKTMLAKAVATECNCTFFNITVSSLVSKWRGDSEKYIRILFELAYHQSPTIIFIDEIDWIATKMDDNSLSEPARRFRAEFLVRLDGLISSENSNVLLMATTNVPWAIDAALLRRLEKHISVTLPDKSTRLEMLKYYVSAELKTSKEINEIAKYTDGYSGADIKMLCKQAWLLQVSPIWQLIDKEEISIPDLNYEIANYSCLIAALKAVKPTTKHVMHKYIDWAASLNNNINNILDDM